MGNHYDQYKAKGYHIGIGTAESACKHLVGQRLKQSGMTWSLAGAEGILQYFGKTMDGIDFGRPEKWQHNFTYKIYMHPWT